MRMFFVFGLLFIFSSLNAQLLEIKGRVFDEKGKPLVGTSIDVKRKWVHASTDDKGAFKLPATKGDSIRFSYLNCYFTYCVTKAGAIDIELKRPLFVVYLSKNSRVGLSKTYESAGRLTSETLNNSIIEESRRDSVTKATSTFMTVEMQPLLELAGSLDTIFSRAIEKKFVKRKDVLELQFIVSKKKAIENIQVLKSYNKQVDRLVIENLKTAFACHPAIQNGSLINADCKVSFNIYTDEGMVKVEIINPENS